MLQDPQADRGRKGPWLHNMVEMAILPLRWVSQAGHVGVQTTFILILSKLFSSLNFTSENIPFCHFNTHVNLPEKMSLIITHQIFLSVTYLTVTFEES